jgi:hypothetical protein
VGSGQLAVGWKSVASSREEEDCSQGEREYARCRIAEYRMRSIREYRFAGRKGGRTFLSAIGFFFDTPSDPKKAAIRFRMTHRLFSFAWRFV